MFGEDVSTLVTSPAIKKLFEVREYAKQLSDNKVELFHSVVVKLFFIIKRSRPDLNMAFGLLTKKVLKSSTDNWENSEGY